MRNVSAIGALIIGIVFLLFILLMFALLAGSLAYIFGGMLSNM